MPPQARPTSILRYGELRLLGPHALLRTGPVDHADWNFRPVLGAIQRIRFHLALDLLPPGRVGSLLEIGYGSGVFLPSLAERCEVLRGVDVHGRAEEVQETLRRAGVDASLSSASAERLPVESGTIDCVVAVSALEFVPDLPATCREVRRVLRGGGCMVLVTPGRSLVANMGLRALTGKRARDDFGDRRDALLPTILRHFRTVEHRTFPPWGGAPLRLYDALRVVPVE